MQHLKVSGAVRPLKWSLGVKWLMQLLSPKRCAYSSAVVTWFPLYLFLRIILSHRFDI